MPTIYTFTASFESDADREAALNALSEAAEENEIVDPFDIRCDEIESET